MARTAPPATPGTDPNAPAATPGADGAAQEIAGALADTPEVQEAVTLADAMKMIAAQQEQMKAMQEQMKALGRTQLAQSMPERVQLPELAEVMRQKPDIPVLTSGGWYVPPVLPQQRVV